MSHRPTSANLVLISQTRTNWLRRLFFEVPYSRMLIFFTFMPLGAIAGGLGGAIILGMVGARK
ncbi:MAG: hypothetical protein ABSF87_19700 [Xanthobacteraceae bacterium]